MNYTLYEIDDLLDVDSTEFVENNRRLMRERADRNWSELQEIAKNNGGKII